MFVKRTVSIFVTMMMFGGCAGDEASSPDGQHDEGVSSGKADGTSYSECELDEVVNLLNDPATTADTLREGGVHSRASRNLILYRDDQDDNGQFDDIEEVDDVWWVGTAAIRQLVAMVTDRCTGRESQAEVIFSPQRYENSHLARVAAEIDEANLSLDIAMYSFRDAGISDAIERAIGRGVSVRMIFESANGDHNDPEGSSSARLEEMGVDVRYVNKIMHHKYVIIDGPRTSAEEARTAVLITGSGNWSNSAGTRYDENTVILRGNEEAILRYQREFNHLWQWSRDLVWNEDLEYFTSLEIVDAMILDDPGIDALFTSANFSTSVHSRYGNLFSVIRGSNVVADRLVELIENAQTSIHVASGHLRSRPVAEALMARHERNPEMDIRVYLDGQEYLSEDYHNDQQALLQACLRDAGDSEAQRQDCLDTGFLFSYALDEVGIAVSFKYYSYRWHYSYAEQMHHKYLIIDGTTLVTGSYNLSDNAEHNTMENILILEASAFPDVVEAFETNFETMWVTAQEEELYAELLDEILNGTDSFPIVFEPMSLSWDEVTALKSAIWDNCPAINSEDFRTNPQAHHYCDR